MPITILEGSTFCLSDDIGDFDGETSGFFSEDTRFLSRFRLRINGERPLLLSSGKVEYFSAAFYMRNPLEGLEQDVLSIERRRFVGEAMQDVISIENEHMTPISFELALEFGNDFADILAVKDHDFALGDPLRAPPLPPVVGPSFDGDASRLIFEDPDDRGVQTYVTLSIPSDASDASDSTVRYRIEIEPRERWELQVGIVPWLEAAGVPPRVEPARFGEELDRVRESLAAWHLHVPHIRASWEELSHSFRQSVADLAALRIRGVNGIGELPAAG